MTGHDQEIIGYFWCLWCGALLSSWASCAVRYEEVGYDLTEQQAAHRDACCGGEHGVPN